MSLYNALTLPFSINGPKYTSKSSIDHHITKVTNQLNLKTTERRLLLAKLLEAEQPVETALDYVRMPTTRQKKNMTLIVESSTRAKLIIHIEPS